MRTLRRQGAEVLLYSYDAQRPPNLWFEMSLSVIAYCVSGAGRLFSARRLPRQGVLLRGMHSIALQPVQLGEVVVGGGAGTVQRETLQVRRDGFARAALGGKGAAEFEVDVGLQCLVIRRGGKCLAGGQRQAQGGERLAAKPLGIVELGEVQVRLRVRRVQRDGLAAQVLGLHIPRSEERR